MVKGALWLSRKEDILSSAFSSSEFHVKQQQKFSGDGDFNCLKKVLLFSFKLQLTVSLISLLF